MSSDQLKPVLINTTEWVEENKKFFLPPVCNKMMHNEGQMKMFFVGGPNQRKDFHIDCGEELFLQVKGDMTLKIVEQGKHRDVRIKEGHMFLLPARIQHSPQRYENTIGLVLERERDPSELDGVRYFVEDNNGNFTTESLYEKWFHCTDLGTQLAPLIKAYFESEQHKTGKPLPGTIPENPPVQVDLVNTVEEPFNFFQWLDANYAEIDREGFKEVFDRSKYQFQVFVYGRGEKTDQNSLAEAWLWQWSGSSTVTVEGEVFRLKDKDSLLVRAGQKFTVKQEAGCRTLVCYQDPRKCTTYPQQ